MPQPLADLGVAKDPIAALCMFFAGLILLIPHRIGISRVNYVIKRYNLPISRAGLLLYKYHNNIEFSLLIGTLLGNIIVWTIGSIHEDLYNSINFPLLTAPVDNTPPKKKNYIISIFMTIFLSLMLLSSIYMFRIYVSGGDLGHLNAFYFSLIFLTIFDGFTNAFAFAINGKNASLLSAGIPLSGLLITLLHYMYKFFSDLFLWDDFDYYVLRLQLFLNILQISVACSLWLCFQVGHIPPSFKIMELFRASPELDDKGTKTDSHICDWCPIFMLAISLGTVYAFYPSISPYSIIDFQYASVIELWILVISSLLPLLFALLDTEYPGNTGQIGPSGKYNKGQTIDKSSITFKNPTNTFINFTDGGSNDQLTLSNIMVKHEDPGTDKIYHGKGATGTYDSSNDATQYKCEVDNPSNEWHPWKKSNPSDSVNYTLSGGNDQYWGISSTGSDESKNLNANALQNFDLDNSGTNKPTITKYSYYSNWFQTNTKLTIEIEAATNGNGSAATIRYDAVTCTITTKNDDHRWYWNLVWLCAIFYILCIQIFMSMLHYPDCLLSCFFKKPLRTCVISILFNTLREVMQACGFAGAGKQCTNFNDFNSSTGKLKFNPTTVEVKAAKAGTNANATNKLTLTQNQINNILKYYKGASEPSGTQANQDFQADNIKANVHLPIYGYTATPKDGSNIHLIPSQAASVNGSIAATNKLITLFVMMFCVFTGDGYLQHYRRCCRDCWPTTGYTKYQSFFYWLHFGFKGGIKSITSSFTATVKTQNIITNNVINLLVAAIVPLT